TWLRPAPVAPGGPSRSVVVILAPASTCDQPAPPQPAMSIAVVPSVSSIGCGRRRGKEVHRLIVGGSSTPLDHLLPRWAQGRLGGTTGSAMGSRRPAGGQTMHITKLPDGRVEDVRS